MADPISIQCPHCKVKLKLKAAPPAGKKIGCPKCKKPFPVKAPAKKKEGDDDFLDALDDLAEDDYEAPEDEDSQEDEEDAPPARSTKRSKSGVATKKGGKGKKGRSKKSSLGPLLAIIGGSVAVLALAGGLVFVLMNLSGSKGVTIRSASGWFIAFLPADADVYVTARPADMVASPLLAPLLQNRQAQQGVAEMEQSFGFPLKEIEHVFIGVKADPNAIKAAQPGAAPMAGNPMMGMPGMPAGMPGMGMPGGNSNGLQDAVVVLRLKQPYGGKTLAEISQQYPPKSHSGVNYHVNSVPNGGAFFFGDERNVVVSDPKWIERVIDLREQAENNTLLDYLAKDQHFTVVVSPKGKLGEVAAPQVGSNPAAPPSSGFGAPPSPELQKNLQEVSTVRLDVNLPAGVDLKISLACKTDTAAQQIHAEVTKQIDQLKQQTQILKIMVPDIDLVLNTLQLKPISGANVEVAVSVPSTVIDRLKQMASQQQPGLGTPGAGVPGQSPGAFPAGVLPTGAVPLDAPPVAAPPATVPPQN